MPPKAIVYTVGLGFVLLIAFFSLRSDPRIPKHNKPSSTPYVPEPISESPTEASLAVMVFNDTDKRPLPSKAEIWFRGHGSWWVQGGSDRQTLGPRPIGKTLTGDDTVVIYPNGRQADDTGQRIDVPIKLTTDMNPDGSTRDALMIEFTDDAVTVRGLPVKAATGETSKTFKRMVDR